MTFERLQELLVAELGREKAAQLIDLLCRKAPGEHLFIPRRAPSTTDIVARAPAQSTAAARRSHRIKNRSGRNWVNAWRRK